MNVCSIGVFIQVSGRSGPAAAHAAITSTKLSSTVIVNRSERIRRASDRDSRNP